MRLREYARPSRKLIGTAAGRNIVVRPPDFAARQRNLDGLIDERVFRLRALRKGRAVDERLEGRARLASRLLDVIERIAAEVAAADPRLDLAVARIDGKKGRLHARFAVAQRLHEVAIRGEVLECVDVGLPGVLRSAILGRLAHERADDIGIAAIAARCARPTRRSQSTATDCLARPPPASPSPAGANRCVVRTIESVGVDVVVVAVRPVDEPLAQLLREMRRAARALRSGARNRRVTDDA